MYVGASDRTVVDPCDHGAAREGAGHGVPEGTVREHSIVVTIDDRCTDVVPVFTCILESRSFRDPEQTLATVQTDLWCGDTCRVLDAAGGVVGGLTRSIIDTVPRGVRPFDQPVVEARDHEAIALTVTQRKHVASGEAASVRICRAARAAELGIAAIGEEAAAPGRVVQRRVLHQRSSSSPHVDTRPARVCHHEVAYLVVLRIVVRAAPRALSDDHRNGVAERQTPWETMVPTAAPRWIEVVFDAVDLEPVRLVLADAVLDDAVGRSVERECVVPVCTIVDAAAAATCSVEHGVGVAPPQGDEPRAPNAERMAVEEICFALLEQHVGAVLECEDVGVLLPVVVGTEKPSERDVIDRRETERVAGSPGRVV